MLGITKSELGEYLQHEIKGRGWTWRETARHADMNYSTLRNVLVGASAPEMLTLQKIATALDIPLARLQAMAGFRVDEEKIGEAEMRGLTGEQRAFLRSLNPERKRAMVDFFRHTLEE